MSEPDFDQLRRAMVSNQLRPNQVTDAVVLAAMGDVPRERFVGADQASVAYRDTIVPLGDGHALNPPIATGLLLNAARPLAGEHVLLIGTATGYVAALLAEMGCKVTALDADKGPLAAGWPEGAPYSLIYIDGAVEQIPSVIADQLAEGGRLVGAIIERGVTRLALGRRVSGGFGLESFADIEAVPLPGFAPAPVFSF
ncbi:protein-L-isoaspartate O-methyltransferase family protein [Sphingomonas abietis]|uniref:Protein-L-isoaspartate O-methyltransferase n=1 Tax=Sphingomonas abietis TaxID=3012344 RepID=A0ABY7NRP6_9SPHN|nr:protein-L-isoaspartate O-methyltransferase [Sphingomonas abietis]WBO24204.1 protein-L-isoaspartate O-methyltransferase [Sphingomonas abietis]